MFLSKIGLTIFSILAAVCIHINSYAQQRNIQFTAGIDAWNAWNWDDGTYVGTTFQIKRYFNLSRFRFSANYNHKYYTGANTFTNNGIVVIVDRFVAHYNVISAIGEFQIYRSKKDYHRGVSVGLGAGYSFSTKNGREYLSGPGVAAKFEYQGGIKNGWFWGAEIFGMYYWSRRPYVPPPPTLPPSYIADNSWHGKLNDMPFILKIGFVPGMKKFKKKVGD